MLESSDELILIGIGCRLGHEWMCFQRYDFVRFLYENLSEEDRESRVLTSKALEVIETTADGVRVTCKDGSVYEGSMLVGADGVNSAVRKDLATKLSDEKLAEPFSTSYRALYGRSTWTKDISEKTVYEMHGDGITIQTIPGKTNMFLLYQRLPATVKGGVRYTKEETEAFAKEVAHIHVAPDVTFGDLWSEAEWSFASGLEEGVAETWYGDRVVLIGDTVHKMTPNIGLGLNSGWQSAVVLTNSLRRLLQKNPEPSTQALNSIFREYQGIRKKDATDMVEVSGLYTRVVAWNNPVWKFVDQHVTKLIGGDCKLMDFLMIPMVKKGLTLDFLNEPNFKTGTTAWTKGRTVVPDDVEALKGSAVKVADVEVAA